MLLNESIKNGYVVPTEYTRKLTIDGQTNSYQVYKIRLDQLFYNDQNDRIATWISKYKSENDLETIDKKVIGEEKYNKIIESFIKESNPKSIEKTKKNIDMVGQREAGVVLNDGRVIDGNRRYTCLRMLHKENIDVNHFEAVILDQEINQNEKEIKLLELTIQHGEETKVDYNPIDRLVGIYNDIIKNKIITKEEYQATVNESMSSINKKIEETNLMVEFLEYINAPEKFYIARDLELDGPLGEIPALLTRARTAEEKDDLKLIIFNNLAIKPVGDITRFIRKMRTIISSEYSQEFIEEQLVQAEITSNKLENITEMNSKVINDGLRGDEEQKNQLKNTLEKYEIKSKKDSTRVKPLQDLQNVQMILSSFDKNLVSLFNSNEKNKLNVVINECLDNLNEIKQYLKS